MPNKPRFVLSLQPGSRWWQPGFLLPAVDAIVIQIVSLVLLVLIFFMASAFDRQITIGMAVLLQGVMAALITWRRRLPLWWLPIQFLFPVGVLAAYAFALPPLIYLVIFLLLVLVYWTPFKTRVPLYLSNRSVWEKIAQFFPENEPIRFIDVGSGLGGLALYLAHRFPQASVTGIELAPFPWWVSWLRGRFSRSRARFILGDYNALDFSQYEIVFAFLSPAAMPALWEKASNEMREGMLLLSYEFIIPDLQPDIAIQESPGDAVLYGWRLTK